MAGYNRKLEIEVYIAKHDITEEAVRRAVEALLKQLAFQYVEIESVKVKYN